MKMKCVLCGGSVTDSLYPYDYYWGKQYLVVIENVPCGICDSCGEPYFDSEIIRSMEMLAQPLIKQAKCSSKGFMTKEKPNPIAVINFTDSQLIESRLEDGMFQISQKMT